MKTLKVSDKLHAELTAVVGQLIAESGKTKTYEDAIEALLHRFVVIPPDLAREIEDFVYKNKQFGYSTKEEFLREAARWLMSHLSREHKSDAKTRQKTNDTEQLNQKPSPKLL
jgi:hemerythrin